MIPADLWPLGLIVLLLAGAYLDVTRRWLPNWLAGLLLAYGLLHAGLTDGAAQLPWYVAHALIALVIGMALFAAGIVGGGDAKFYAGAASYFVLQDGLRLLAYVSFAAVALVALWFVIRRMTGKGIGRPSDTDDATKFPFGLAIAAGGILAAMPA